MRSVRSQLTFERASQLEPQVQARAEQMKPRGTPLGICRICSKAVYGGDRLVLTAGSPLHDACRHPQV